MIRKLIYILLLSFSSLIQAQNLDVDLLKTIANSKSIKFATYDHLGDFYLVQNNQLIKQSTDKKYNYSNLLYGEISYIDVRNPFQILVFYKNFQSFVVLDNQLNEIRSFNISEKFPELDVRLVSTSIKNSYWFFDDVSKRIFLFDVGQENLKPISVPFENSFEIWNSNANSFFIESKSTIYSYDIYGKVSKNSFTTKFDKLLLVSPTAFIYENNQDLYYQNIKSNEKLKINLPKKSMISFEITNEILTIFTESEINIYKLNLP